MRASLVVAVVGGLLTTGLMAQPEPIVRLGDRVRVAVRGQGSRPIGALARLTADSMVIGDAAISRSNVTHLELSTGRKSRWLRGLGIGFAAGVAAGAIVGAAHPCLDGEFTQLWCAAAFGVVGGAVGLPIGALIGSGSHTDRWRPIALDRVRLAAAPGGLRIGLAVAL